MIADSSSVTTRRAGIVTAIVAAAVLAVPACSSTRPTSITPVATSPTASPTSSTSRSPGSSGSSTNNDDDEMFSTTTTLKTSKVTEFEQIKGSTLESQQEAARSRFARSTFVFRTNGRFTYDTSASKASDLFPVSGKWERKGSSVTFSGASNGSGASLAIRGTVRRTSGGYAIEINTASSRIMVAVVNDQAFGSNASAVYRANLVAVRD